VVGGFMVGTPLVLAFLALMTGLALRAKPPHGERPVWTRPLALGLGSLGLVLAVSSLIYAWLDPAATRNVDAAHEQQHAYTMAKLRVTAEYLAGRYEGESVLLVTPPQFGNAQDPEAAARVDAFVDALDGKMPVAARVPVGVFETSGGFVPGSVLTAARLDEIVAAHPGIHVIVCLTPFPADYEDLTFWRPATDDADAEDGARAAKSPAEVPYHILMVEGFPGAQGSLMSPPNPVNFVPYLKSGVVTGIVVERADFVWTEGSELPDGGDRSIFAARYIFLNEYNLYSILEEHPEWQPMELD